MVGRRERERESRTSTKLLGLAKRAFLVYPSVRYYLHLSSLNELLLRNAYTKGERRVVVYINSRRETMQVQLGRLPIVHAYRLGI